MSFSHPRLSLLLPWEEIDSTAQEQICAVLELPELQRLAIMPDVHAGYDLCIGGVALLQGLISPSFVGYDIGCGMCHVNTGFSQAELGLTKPNALQELFARLEKCIPAGVGKEHNSQQQAELLTALSPAERQCILFESALVQHKALSAQEQKEALKRSKHVHNLAKKQVGTLGSGNHFLEIGINKKGHVGVTVHSGSRRCGYDIAAYYMQRGRFFPVDSPLGQSYWQDMLWALDFALLNRKHILYVALKCLGLSISAIQKMLHDPAAYINENHNHATKVAYSVAGEKMSSPTRENLVLHRKGATPAKRGQLGIIPIHQKEGVYITEGLGNETYLSSASHGAGRKYSRNKSRSMGTTSDLQKLMKGIVCRTDRKMLDEAPWVYKESETVLASQEGVVIKLLDHFRPLLVLKGA